MKLSKVLHVATIISGVLGFIAFFGTREGGMMGGGQNSMFGDAVFFLLVAILLQLGAIHHMVLEKRGEII